MFNLNGGSLGKRGRKEEKSGHEDNEEEGGEGKVDPCSKSFTTEHMVCFKST